MRIWKEKWNYEPIFIGSVSDQTKNDFALPVIAELYDVSSLSFNNIENDLISKILRVCKKLFEINNVKPIVVNKQQIIILNQNVFKRKILNNDNETGKCSSGYVYVCRNNNIPVFLSELAHELSHLFSFYSLLIKEEYGKRYINVYRLGYYFKDGDDVKYNGLNEAVTELLSKVILKELFKTYPDVLNANEKDEALNYYGYPYYVALLEEIIFNLDNSNFLTWLLFKSYFDGSSDFLKILKQEFPKVFLVFKNMGYQS